MLLPRKSKRNRTNMHPTTFSIEYMVSAPRHSVYTQYLLVHVLSILVMSLSLSLCVCDGSHYRRASTFSPAMKSGRSEDPLYVSTVLVKGSPPRGRARRGKPDRATETRNGNTGFTSRQLPSYVTVPLLVAADVSKKFRDAQGLKRESFVLE